MAESPARRPTPRRGRPPRHLSTPTCSSPSLAPPAFKAGGYWIGTPGIFPQIHIIQTENVPPGPGAPISPVARHTAFEVADYDAMKATLEREGIKYVENTQPGGRVQMLCNDPDGNTLEFQPATV